LPKQWLCSKIINEKGKVMPVITNNVYGNISITDKTIEKFVAHNTLDCYGIVEFVSSGIIRTVLESIFKKSMTKGVKVKTLGDRIFIDVFVILKYGVSINAVAESLKESIKYKVEKFTGMLVDVVNINIMGVRI
jgi:uncharacterized alkaline shock family protein YloU